MHTKINLTFTSLSVLFMFKDSSYTVPNSVAVPSSVSDTDSLQGEGRPFKKLLKAHKYRVYPNESQKQKLDAHFGACRFVYNLALETKIAAYQSTGINLSAFTLMKDLIGLKQIASWLSDVNSQSLQASILNLDYAFKRLFTGMSAFPRYKSKRGTQSFQCPQSVKIEGSRISVPKIRGIRIVLDRPVPVGKIKTVTISRTKTGKYYASILVDTIIEVAPTTNSGCVGIDLGLSHFAILSDGTKIDNPKFLRNSLSRINCLQRRVARKKKGSANRKKAVHTLALAYEHVTNKRKDFLHKTSTRIVRDSQAGIICVEDLATSNMMKNHNLAQAITDVSWSEFVRQLQYKCDWNGKQLVKVDRFYPSSKTCSMCGVIADLKLSDRIWTCECGTTHDRDVNAAVNIQKEGLRISGKGIPVEPVESSALVGTMKQELIS